MSDFRHFVGVMSGTSLDGIDVAVIRLSTRGDSPSVDLVAFDARPFPSDIRDACRRASAGEMSLREVYELEVDLGACYADAIQGVLRTLPSDLQVEAIGLHGQTVYHNPLRAPNGVTVQLHGAPFVAERLGIPVVSDFRSADVAAGGEGAPLVPYCDYMLLRSTGSNRVALNIGGIANITWLPRGCGLESIVAFDTGPGNMMIDAAMARLFDRPYDEGGAVAASVLPDARWLEELMTEAYFRRPFPKSTGREDFGDARTFALIDDAMGRGIAPASIISTLTALTARGIVAGIRLAAGSDVVDEVVAAGGGVNNIHLIDLLSRELPEASIRPTSDYGLPADAKEAICFAILADANLRGIPANIPSVTGARRKVVLGARWQPHG